MKIPRLREWREAMGQTQANLSERSGVSEHTISGGERGASLRPSTAKKLADAMGVEVTDLMDKPPALSYAGKAEGKAEAPSSGRPRSDNLVETKTGSRSESIVDSKTGSRSEGIVETKPASRYDSLVEEEAPGLRPIDLALDAARRQAVLTRQAFNRAATSGVPQGENMRPLNEAFGTLQDHNPGDVAEGLVDLAREYVALEQEAAGIREQVAALQEELTRERARVR